MNLAGTADVQVTGWLRPAHRQARRGNGGSRPHLGSLPLRTLPAGAVAPGLTRPSIERPATWLKALP